MSQSAMATKSSKSATKLVSTTAEVRKAAWEVEAEEESPSGWQYGPDAVCHPTEPTGRRSVLFPGLNITATAANLGVTKSHLAKVLSGVNQPSVSLAQKIAEALGTDLNVVVGLYRGKTQIKSVSKPPKAKSKTRKVK